MQLVAMARLSWKVSSYRKPSDSRPVVKLRVIGPRGEAMLGLSMSPDEAVELAADLVDAAAAANELVGSRRSVDGAQAALIRVDANDPGLCVHPE